MTERNLRDDFAMAALSGLLSSSENVTDILGVARKHGGNMATVASDIAYEIADAMLEARKPDPLGRDSRGVTQGMRDYLAKGGAKQ